MGDRAEGDKRHQVVAPAHLAEIEQHGAGRVGDPLPRRFLIDDHATVEEVPPIAAPLRCRLEVRQVDQVVWDGPGPVFRVGQPVQRQVWQQVRGAGGEAVEQPPHLRAAGNVPAQLAELPPLKCRSSIHAQQADAGVLGRNLVFADFVDVHDLMLWPVGRRGLGLFVDEGLGELAPGVEVVVVIRPRDPDRRISPGGGDGEL